MERIENRRFERNIKFLKWGAILSWALVIFNIITNLEMLWGKGSAFDYSPVPSSIFFYYFYKRTAKNWGGQFIEWTEDCISFKTRTEQKTVLNIADLQDIEIKLEEITLKLKNGKEYKLIVEDFREYKDRIRIKEKFAQIKSEIPELNPDYTIENK